VLRSRSGRGGEEKNSLPQQGIEFQCSNRSLVSTLEELPRLIDDV